MKISNYQLLEIKAPEGPLVSTPTFLATVDVTTGFWFWKKTETRKVFKSPTNVYYRFMDTGESTPGHDVENLSKAYFAQKGQYKYA